MDSRPDLAVDGYESTQGRYLSCRRANQNHTASRAHAEPLNMP